MYTAIKGNKVEVLQDNGSIVRQYHLRSNVTQATVSGDTVAIVCTDGYTYLYNTIGQMIRRTKIR